MEALEGLVTINGTDIWKEYGAFLTEEKRGGRENLTAIMTPAKVKAMWASIYANATAHATRQNSM